MTLSPPPRTAPARLSPSLKLAAPAAAIGYPFLLKAFHAAVTRTEPAYAVLAAIMLALAIAVPLVGFFAAVKLGERSSPTSNEVLSKWIALLSMASAPIYTVIGVLLYMAGDPVSDVAVWLAGWAIGLALMAKAAFAPEPTRTAPPQGPASISPRLRVAHGLSAFAILVLFLGMHIANHLGGLVSEATHRTLMDVFRHLYRARLIEPLVVALFLFMVVSGLALVSGYVKQQADVFRTLQIASGIYLVFFVLGHVNSVFFYARMFLKIPTDWNFATGAPTGLIRDAWNIRLLPHYLLGVFLVLSHLVIGARTVAIAHQVNEARANRWTWAGIAVSALIAVAIILGMTGVHLSH